MHRRVPLVPQARAAAAILVVVLNAWPVEEEVARLKAEPGGDPQRFDLVRSTVDTDGSTVKTLLPAPGRRDG